MNRRYTRLFGKILAAFMNPLIRYIILPGGTSSSKTFSVLDLLLEIAKRMTNNCLISICSETFPHLQRGAMRDWVNILGDEYSAHNHNKTNHIYTINKTQLEFFAVDEPGRARGPRRNILYCNEVNNFKKEIFEDLEIRTDYKVIVDYNPTAEFWITEYFDLENSVVIKSNYLDNECLPESIRERIRMKAEKDQNFKRVHIDVEWGSNEGLIYPHFVQIDELPEFCKKERYGLDFGYTNDPTAFAYTGITGDNLYIHELIYEPGMTNQDISKRFTDLNINKYIPIIADCAEPKSITEINEGGWDIQPCEKGKDSVNAGIDQVKQSVIHVTKSSVNAIKELRNYRWALNKLTGKATNKPVDDNNHLMDAVRYAVREMVQPEPLIMRLS